MASPAASGLAVHIAADASSCRTYWVSVCRAVCHECFSVKRICCRNRRALVGHELSGFTAYRDDSG